MEEGESDCFFLGSLAAQTLWNLTSLSVHLHVCVCGRTCPTPAAKQVRYCPITLNPPRNSAVPWRHNPRIRVNLTHTDLLDKPWDWHGTNYTEEILKFIVSLTMETFHFLGLKITLNNTIFSFNPLQELLENLKFFHWYISQLDYVTTQQKDATLLHDYYI